MQESLQWLSIGNSGDQKNCTAPQIVQADASFLAQNLFGIVNARKEQLLTIRGS